VYAQYSVQVENRQQVLTALKDAGIPSAVHYPIPLNKQPAVFDDTVYLAHGDRIAEKVLSVPMHPYLTEGAQVKVLNAFARFL
jgi:UDP-2-acetamido-2-deoxy-ribo-hexuluronate aminotransferase